MLINHDYRTYEWNADIELDGIWFCHDCLKAGEPPYIGFPSTGVVWHEHWREIETPSYGEVANAYDLNPEFPDGEE